MSKGTMDKCFVSSLLRAILSLLVLIIFFIQCLRSLGVLVTKCLVQLS